MKTLVLFILFFPCWVFAEKNLLLTLGESHKIPLKGHPAIWIQDRKIIKAEGLGGFLMIKAQNEGQTLLRVGAESWKVQVLHPASKDSISDLQHFLKGIVGLQTQTREGRLHVHGTLYRLQDWQALARFVQNKDLKFQLTAEVPLSLQSEAQRFFLSELKKSKLPPQTLIFSPSAEMRIKASDLLREKYERLLHPYGINLVYDKDSLDIAPTIKVEITVAEVQRSLQRTWGVLWPASYGATVLPDGSWNRGSLELSLQAEETKGQARILASPNLLCRSGEEAEFLAGGEFPIRNIGYRTESISWRKYGISLKIKPRADASGRIRLSLETEVTSLDPATTVDGVPGLKTHKVSSHFDLTQPQTIALSGLIKNDEGKNSQGLPWLSNMPVFGPLFSSRGFIENKTELVIFVRPRILDENEAPESLAHLPEAVGESRN